MNVITVSREYGAGGAEVARRLASELKWELLDREFLHQAAAVEQVPDSDLERLDEKAINMIDRLRFHPPHQRYIHGITEAARQAAARGNVVLVGRGARHLLGDLPNCFHLRLVASREWRVQHMVQTEGGTPERAMTRCLEVERSRANFTRYFFGSSSLQSDHYDLVVNTGRVSLDQVVACVASFIRKEHLTDSSANKSRQRVLTLARELGDGDRDFPSTLATRLRLRMYDHDLLEQEALKLGVPKAELEKIDEQPTGNFQWLRSDGLSQRYFESLGNLMNQLACSDVLLVGRGGNRFLREQPRAFHVCMAAPMLMRVKRVMEQHWLRQDSAQKLITDSDNQHRRFYSDHFSADWTDPLEYHVTVNSGRLGSTAVDLIALAAELCWQRLER